MKSDLLHYQKIYIGSSKISENESITLRGKSLTFGMPWYALPTEIDSFTEIYLNNRETLTCKNFLELAWFLTKGVGFSTPTFYLIKIPKNARLLSLVSDLSVFEEIALFCKNVEKLCNERKHYTTPTIKLEARLLTIMKKIVDRDYLKFYIHNNQDYYSMYKIQELQQNRLGEQEKVLSLQEIVDYNTKKIDELFEILDNFKSVIKEDISRIPKTLNKREKTNEILYVIEKHKKIFPKLARKSNNTIKRLLELRDNDLFK